MRKRKEKQLCDQVGRKRYVEAGMEKSMESSGVTILELRGSPGKGCIIFIEKAEPFFFSCYLAVVVNPTAPLR